MAKKKINLTEELKKYFGFDTFKGNQEAIIENLLAGNDTFVLMPTGGGKSLMLRFPMYPTIQHTATVRLHGWRLAIKHRKWTLCSTAPKYQKNIAPRCTRTTRK